jgi:transcriptional regulator with XRE-family HTH domain
MKGAAPMTAPAEKPQARPSQEAVLTKAVLRAADKLDVSQAALARVLGVSPAQVSRMRNGDAALSPGSKAFELGAYFVRLFRSLDSIVGGDEASARAWLANPNLALGAEPAEKINTIAGLTDVIQYLDARRAPI